MNRHVSDRFRDDASDVDVEEISEEKALKLLPDTEDRLTSEDVDLDAWDKEFGFDKPKT